MLPANTKPFRFCNECPVLHKDIKARWCCDVYGVLKVKKKHIGNDEVVEEPVRHIDCKTKPKNANIHDSQEHEGEAI